MGSQHKKESTGEKLYELLDGIKEALGFNSFSSLVAQYKNHYNLDQKEDSLRRKITHTKDSCTLFSIFLFIMESKKNKLEKEIRKEAGEEIREHLSEYGAVKINEICMEHIAFLIIVKIFNIKTKRQYLKTIILLSIYVEILAEDFFEKIPPKDLFKLILKLKGISREGVSDCMSVEVKKNTIDQNISRNNESKIISYINELMNFEPMEGSLENQIKNLAEDKISW